MDCFETAARLHLYIDRELSSEEISTVQYHLAQCPGCECRFHFNKSLKRLIHERCTIVTAPSHLREAVFRLARLPANEQLELDPALEMEIRADLDVDDC